MKKFDQALSKMYQVILEQDVPPPAPDSQTAGAGPIGPGNGPNKTDAALPSDETSGEITPEGEVMLIRLIAKALTCKPTPEDLVNVVGLKDINETNATVVLKKLIEIIQKYSEVEV